MTVRRSLAVALLAAAGLSPASAAAQLEPDPVAVAVEGLFGAETLLAGGWSAAHVALSNRTESALSGVVRVDVRSLEGATMRYEAPVDLPARAGRSLTVPLFARTPGQFVEASFVAGGRRLGADTAELDWSRASRSVVVLQDPPRLRQALVDLDVEVSLDGGPRRQMRIPVGSARLDGATGDPVLPTLATEWSTVRLLVAAAPMIERAGEAERRAITDWVRGGGRLLVFPRTAADLDRPWLRELVGPLTTGPPAAEAAPLVPDDVRRLGLICGEDRRTESFGCSTTVGFGRVYLADYDGTTESAIASGAPRELVRSIFGAELATGPALRIGRSSGELSGGGAGSGGAFTPLRRALDPNEGFRPALLLVALVLLFYVIVVGPLNFRFVQKRNAPVLALATTPAAALGCFAVLLGVGYVGKGVSMRYRRVTLVEAAEGQARMFERSYQGLFSTRPGSFDLPPPPDGRLLPIEGRVSEGPVHRHGPRGVALDDLRAGLWETTFVREERIVEPGGALRFERDGRRLAAVVNETSLTLRGAVIVDPAGDLYHVGDVPPGGRAEIATRTLASVSSSFVSGYHLRVLADRLGLDEDEQPYLAGLVQVLGGALAPGALPILYARLEPSREEIGGRFGAEADVAFLRLTPRLLGGAVAPAPPPLEVDRWGDPIVPRPEESLPPPGAPGPMTEPGGAEADAGAPPPDGGAS